MATSTSTLLEVVNRVLLNANERTLTTTTPLIGQQVKECIRSALYQMTKLGEWTWTQAKVNASSWSSQVATLPATTQRVKAMSWDNDDGILIPIQFISRSLFDGYELEAYTDNTGRPNYWTIVDYNVVHVNPYPNSAGERIKIWFYTNKYISLPSSDSGTFDMPEEFTNLLVLGATSMFYKRHMEDINVSRAFEDEFVVELQQARARQMTIPAQSFNLYKRTGEIGSNVLW